MKSKIVIAVISFAIGWLAHHWCPKSDKCEIPDYPAPVVPPLAGDDKLKQAERLEIVSPAGDVVTVLWVSPDGKAMISVKDGDKMRAIDLARAARWMH